MEKHDELFTPGQVDQQIEGLSHTTVDERDAATGDEASARLLLDIRRAYRQQASAHQDALERVLDRLLQHEARPSSRSPYIPQEKKPHMGHPISGPIPRHTLAQRLGLLAAAALLILLVGSMAVVINIAHQQKAITGKQATTKATAKAGTTTISNTQLNLYVAFGNTVEKLDSKSGKVLWTYKATNIIPWPVTVANGIVYVVPENSSLYALNATNGKLLWQTKNRHFNWSVVVVQTTAYAIDPIDGYVSAINALNGELLWQNHLGIPVGRLAVADGSIYVSAEIATPAVPLYGVLYALRASDGAEIWHTTISNQFFNTLQVVNGVAYADSTLDDKSVNPPDRHSYVYAFDVKTGALLWRSDVIKAYVDDAPTVANNIVYVGSNALGIDGPSIYAFNASNGTLVWKKQVNYSVDSLLVHNGVVYAPEGTQSSAVETPMLALDASNGSVRWSHPFSDYFEFEYQSSAINDNLIYVATLDGLIHVLRATDGTQVRTYSLGNARFFMMPPTLVMAP